MSTIHYLFGNFHFQYPPGTDVILFSTIKLIVLYDNTTYPMRRYYFQSLTRNQSAAATVRCLVHARSKPWVAPCCVLPKHRGFFFFEYFSHMLM